MEDIRITFNDLVIYIFVVNIVLGLLLGVFPLIAGFKLKNRKYGFYGFFASIAGGIALGLFLSYPLAVAFVWLICRKEKARSESISSQYSVAENSLAE